MAWVDAPDIGANFVRDPSTGQVVDKNHPLYTSAQPAAPAGGGTGTAAAPPPPQNAQQAYTQPVTVGAQTPQGQPTNVAGAFQQALVNKLMPAPVNAQNPEIQPAIQANKLAEQRGLEGGRAQLAERAAAQGFNNSGGFEGLLAGQRQDSAGRQASFEGQQVADLGNRQSQQIMAALGLAGGGLGQLQGFQTQQTLADLDAALRREGLSLQSALGNKELDLRQLLGEGQLNLGVLSALLQNQQFGQNLGFQSGLAGAQLDQNALALLLGGL
jgi:hypothetical protein